jgi:hypothetical protein
MLSGEGWPCFAWAVQSLESSKVQDSRKPRPQITPGSEEVPWSQDRHTEAGR